MSEDQEIPRELFVIYRGEGEHKTFFSEELGWRDKTNFKIVNHFPTRYTREDADKQTENWPNLSCEIAPWSNGSWWKSKWD